MLVQLLAGNKLPFVLYFDFIQRLTSLQNTLGFFVTIVFRRYFISVFVLIDRQQLLFLKLRAFERLVAALNLKEVLHFDIDCLLVKLLWFFRWIELREAEVFFQRLKIPLDLCQRTGNYLTIFWLLAVVLVSRVERNLVQDAFGPAALLFVDLSNLCDIQSDISVHNMLAVRLLGFTFKMHFKF